MTSKRWYLAAGGLVVVGALLAVVGILGLLSTIDGLARVVMPGKAEISLPAGDTTLYAEHRSIVGDKLYVIAEQLNFRCAVVDPAGKPLVIEPPSSQVSYAVGGYAGRNTFDLHVATAGAYMLTCDAPSQFVMAIGRGVGTQIVIALVGGFVPVLLGTLTLVVVLVKRRRQKRRAQAAHVP